MYGNLRSCESEPSAADVDAFVWLATPHMAAAYDESVLTPADRVRRVRLKRAASIRDFQVSRSLLQHIGWTSASLSHSAGYAAAVQPRSRAARAARWGVDVEAHRPRAAASLAAFAFAPEEASDVAALSGTAQQQRFYALWTLKEALAKALGLSLTSALRECIVDWRAGALRTPRPCSALVFRYEYLTLAVVCADDAAPLRIQMRTAGLDAPLQWRVAASFGAGLAFDADPENERVQMRSLEPPDRGQV